MPSSTRNLLTPLPCAHHAEISEAMVTGRGLRLERIVSLGQVSPEGAWYDQDEAEWVMVRTGGARLAIAGEVEERTLGPGDAVFLPAHSRHRVVWTDPDRPTVWLALFVDPKLNPSAVNLVL